jgi:hypothetical protein
VEPVTSELETPHTSVPAVVSPIPPPISCPSRHTPNPQTATVPEAAPIPLTKDEEQTVATTVAHVQAFAGLFAVDRLFQESDLTTIITEAFVAASGEYGIRAAQEWAGGYEFPPTLLAREETAFKEAGNLEEFSRQRQQLLDHERLRVPQTGPAQVPPTIV